MKQRVFVPDILGGLTTNLYYIIKTHDNICNRLKQHSCYIGYFHSYEYLPHLTLLHFSNNHDIQGKRISVIGHNEFYLLSIDPNLKKDITSIVNNSDKGLTVGRKRSKTLTLQILTFRVLSTCEVEFLRHRNIYIM